jgi:hypothetical protein
MTASSREPIRMPISDAAVSSRTSHAFTFTVSVACCLLAVAAVIATALPASARAACTTLKPKSASAPYLITPCNEASVAEHSSVTFIVYDSNSQTRQSTKDYPYLDLATVRDVTDGQLAASTNGTGVFQQLSPRPGHKDEWTLTVKPQTYRAWWDNHTGNCYVQIRQLDPSGTDGVIDSPIVTVRVAANRG